MVERVTQGGPPLLLTTDLCPECGLLTTGGKEERAPLGEKQRYLLLDCGNGHLWTRKVTEPMPPGSTRIWGL